MVILCKRFILSILMRYFKDKRCRFYLLSFIRRQTYEDSNSQCAAGGVIEVNHEEIKEIR
ncbi:hypothetical protein MtrunA17_Chr2g0292591 [Medicago truncatula]|uniref:Uncharacterized protein n=1 Tax=Medicago truncatula TaxID=3880 RepID=A0A396J8P8_MEDTR|nr:hypothetical protein MtrunA17_Chr2g0292591 [Medicago truncatula]